MKDQLGGKIMTEVVGLRGKTYSYLIDGSSEDKKENVNLKIIETELKIIETV